MIELNSKLTPHPEVITTELDNKEAVLLHLGTKNYYSLNETGMRIWQLLSEGITLRGIHEKLQQEYDISPEQAEKSILNLTNELVHEKLVTVSDG
jgi:hypothetical protein